MSNPAERVAELGQSIWYDNISRDLLESGEVARLVAEEGVRRITSNPSIFQKAMSASPAYAEQFAELARLGNDAAAIYEACAIADIRAGADLLRGVHDASGGRDGFVSLEVAPSLANDSEGTIADAARLWRAVDRPNLMIKIPATPAGMPAIRASLAAGINVNVTLIFAIEAYSGVIEAYLAGLEDRLAAGGDIAGVNSVASFFVSRVDSAVDKQLTALAERNRSVAERALALRGKAAVANAKLAYELFERRFGDERFARLREHGAAVQRPLWASTSTKNPGYPDTLYVDTLIGPHTVNTLPPATLAAFTDHGIAAESIHEGLEEYRSALLSLEGLGISMTTVCETLLEAGVASFAKAFDGLLAAVEERRKAVLPA